MTAVLITVTLCYASVLFVRTWTRLRLVCECVSDLPGPQEVTHLLAEGYTGYLLMLAPVVDPDGCSDLGEVKRHVHHLGSELIVIDGPEVVPKVPALARSEMITMFPSLVAMANGVPCFKAIAVNRDLDRIRRYINRTLDKVKGQ